MRACSSNLPRCAGADRDERDARRDGRRVGSERARRSGDPREGGARGSPGRARSDRSAAACGPPNSRCRGSGTTSARPCIRRRSPRRSSPRSGCATGCSSSSPRRPTRIRSAGARPRSPTATSTAPHSSSGTTVRRGAASSNHSSSTWPASHRSPRPSCCGCRRIRSTRSATPAGCSNRGRSPNGWRFRDLAAEALFAGVAAHTPGRHPSLATAGTGLLLGAHAHAGGWGVPVGGSQAIADALADEFLALGGRIDTRLEVRSPADLEPSRGSRCSTPRPSSWPASPVKPSQPVTVVGWHASGAGRASRSSTWPCSDRCPGRIRESLPPRPCTSAARGPRSPRPSAR